MTWLDWIRVGNIVTNLMVISCFVNEREVAGYAEWIARHVHEVGYRWSGLLHSVQRWAMYDVGSVTLRVAPRPNESNGDQ